MVQLMPLPPGTPSSLASFKSRLVLSFWYWLTLGVVEKRRLNGCNSSSIKLAVVNFTAQIKGCFYSIIEELTVFSFTHLLWNKCHKKVYLLFFTSIVMVSLLTFSVSYSWFLKNLQSKFLFC